MSDIPVFDKNFVFPKKEDFKRFKDGIFNNEGWKVKYCKDQMKVLTKTFINSEIRACKVHSIINDIDPHTLFEVLHDNDYRKIWDFNMIDGYIIDKIDDHTEIGYYAINMPSILANRDFCILKTWKASPKKGEWIMFKYSVNHPNCPERRGFIRANSILSGYYIRKLNYGTEFNYYTQCDPRGWIPASIVNRIIIKLTPRLMDQIFSATKSYNIWKEKKNQKNKSIARKKVES